MLPHNFKNEIHNFKKDKNKYFKHFKKINSGELDQKVFGIQNDHLKLLVGEYFSNISRN